MNWLRLIRWSNLLIIFLTQAVAWWCVIVPMRHSFGVQLLLTPANFLLLTISTMLIAAAGYIINDYFDIRIDAINKPDAVILEKTIPRRLAIIVHSVMNVLALLLAGIVAWQGHHIEWLILQLACTAMLWRYSTTWKRRFMTGNIVVAVMTALTVLTLLVYEPASLKILPCNSGHGKIVPLQVLCAFAAFAFLLTWMREIVKDMEDYKGDDAEGCVTMPIRSGLLVSMRFTRFLGLVSVALLLCAIVFLRRYNPRSTTFLSAYLGAALVLPLLLWILKLPRAATRLHFSKMSRWLKIIMVLGICSLLIYRY